MKAFVPNRVGGNHLSSNKPVADLADIPNGAFLPDKSDHFQQRLNYIILVQRIITKEIDCLKFLSSVVLKHIPHRYSKELSKKADMVHIFS